jgi:hypothetical protein
MKEQKPFCGGIFVYPERLGSVADFQPPPAWRALPTVVGQSGRQGSRVGNLHVCTFFQYIVTSLYPYSLTFFVIHVCTMLSVVIIPS